MIGEMLGIIAALIVNAGAILFLLCLWLILFFILTDGTFDEMDIGVLVGLLIAIPICRQIYREERARGAI